MARLNLLTCIPYTLNPFIASRAALAIPIELVKQRKLTGQSKPAILVHCIINNKFSISKNIIVTYDHEKLWLTLLKSAQYTFV